MASYSDKQTEKRLKALEKRIAREYNQAAAEMKAKAEEYFDKLEKRYKEEYRKYKEDGAYTDAEFKAWYKTQVERGEGYLIMAEQLAQRVSGANIVASAYINDTTPSIFSLNQSYEAYSISSGSPYQNANWHLYDEQTIRNLITDDENVVQFKVTKVNAKRDYEWNYDQIRKATTVAILQGKPIDEIADSYMQVMKRNRASAMRNARTAVTSAQNAGRYASYERAAEMGIDVRKEWVCTHDARTRDSHADLDGEIVPYSKPFSNGLMYPADAEGAPAEVYNCRCTMVVNLPEFDRDETRPTYGDWIEEQKKLNTVPKSEYEAKKMRANSRAVKRWENRHNTNKQPLPAKPKRPLRANYKTESEYYDAREAYKAQKEEYEKLKSEWIKKNTPNKMAESEIAEWIVKNDIFIYGTLDGIDTSVLRAFFERYESLIKDFPEVKEIAIKLYYNNKVNVSYTGDISYLMEASGGFNFGRLCSDFARLIDNRIDQITDGYLVAGADGVNGLFDHEFGHNVYTALRYKDNRTTEDRVKMAEDLFKSVSGKNGASEYSYTNDSELFAEGFCAWYGGEDTEFAKAFGEFIKRWR